MSFGKLNLTNIAGYKTLFKESVDYTDVFGGNLNVFFKPFTTKVNDSGIARYGKSIFNTSGILDPALMFLGADSSGLNPFGPFTLGESIVSNVSRPQGIDLEIDRSSVRTFGLKTPNTLVGWGYDIFGFPAPNYNNRWATSGKYAGTSVAPSSTFLSSGYASVAHGSQVVPTLWNAGPADMRWDPYRKVWTSAQSVYAAVITQGYRNNMPITIGDVEPTNPSEITYNVRIYDNANPIHITGIQPINRRSDDIKVVPHTSGDKVLIMHYRNSNGQPDFGLWTYEEKGTVACGGLANDADTIQTIQDLTSADSLLYSSLAGDPLEYNYGGTSFASYTSGQLLVGKTGGSLERLTLTEGTGLLIKKVGTTLVFALGSGVQFLTSGVNTTIREIQGLTTPLSLSQGGTGASGKNFVDLTQDQVVGGNKIFVSGISVGRAASGLNNINFNGYFNTGFSVASGNVIKINNSGVNSFRSHSTGIYVAVPLTVSPYASGRFSLRVEEGVNTNGYRMNVQEWVNRYTNQIGYFDNDGTLSSNQLSVSGVTVSGYKNLLNIIIGSGNDAKPINVYSKTNGNVFGVNPSGDVIIGPTGFATVIRQSSGNKTVNLPLTSGTFALKTDIGYRNRINLSGHTDYSISHLNDVIFCITTGFLRLPLSAPISGKVFTIRNNAVASVLIYPSGSDLIDGVSTSSVANGTTKNLISDGSGLWNEY